MRKRYFRTAVACVALCLSLAVCGVVQARKTSGGRQKQVVVNTTESGKDIKGFKGPVPVEVTFIGGKITKVTVLPNHETPRFLQRAVGSGLLEQWNGLTAKQAAVKEVDAVSGATYSSRAIIENVRVAARQMKK